MSAATADWQRDRDGWQYRQQQWGEPSDFGHPYAFVSRGIIHARGAAAVAAVEAACAPAPQLDLRLAA